MKSAEVRWPPGAVRVFLFRGSPHVFASQCGVSVLSSRHLRRYYTLQGLRRTSLIAELIKQFCSMCLFSDGLLKCHIPATQGCYLCPTT